MTHRHRNYVLDASALLGFLYQEPGGLRVMRLLKEAEQSSVRIVVSVVNLGEVFYQCWHRGGEEPARTAMADLSRLSLQIVPVALEHALKAAEIKVQHHLPYADCFAASLAALHQATLVTSDRDFEKLGRHFPILWLSR